MKYLFFILLIVTTGWGCSSASRGESKILRNLQKSKAVQHGYYLYPSTLRMVNLDHLPEYDGAVKNIRRLSVLSLWPEAFTLGTRDSLLTELETKEGFTMYAEMDNGDHYFKLVGRNEGTEGALLFNDSTNNYVVHLLGSVDISQLLKLAIKIRDSDNELEGLNTLIGVFRQDQSNAERRRYYQRRNAARQAREEAVKDSLQQVEQLEAPLAD